MAILDFMATSTTGTIPITDTLARCLTAASMRSTTFIPTKLEMARVTLAMRVTIRAASTPQDLRVAAAVMVADAAKNALEGNIALEHKSSPSLGGLLCVRGVVNRLSQNRQ